MANEPSACKRSLLLILQKSQVVGLDVAQAFDGPTGVGAIERFHPDAIVFDVMLPDIQD